MQPPEIVLFPYMDFVILMHPRGIIQYRACSWTKFFSGQLSKVQAPGGSRGMM